MVTASSLFRDEGEMFIPSGVIVCTSLCHLDLHPELKHFLTDPDGAESYQNVQVVFAEGQRPILTVYYDDNIDSEEHIQLWHLKSREEYHSLMSSKGFVPKTGVKTVKRKSFRGTFHHTAAKHAFLEAKDRGEDTVESSKAAMDAFLQSRSEMMQAEADLGLAIHRGLKEQQSSVPEPVHGDPKYKNSISI
jgi:hypothetical protein